MPRATRTYLVQQVLSAGLTTDKVDILARYRNFFHGLRHTPCYEVSFMANMVDRNIRSTTGSNLSLVQEESGLDPWQCSPVELKMEKVMVPVLDQWRVQYIATLFEQRQELHYVGAEEEEEELRELIDNLCIT